MSELFSNGTYLVVFAAIIALVGGWVAIDDYIARRKGHKSSGPQVGR